MYHNNKGTTERCKLLHLGWSSMEMCDDTQDMPARVLLSGIQQGHSRKRRVGHCHTHSWTAVLFFSSLARTLHSFHNTCFQLIHSTRPKTDDGRKPIPMDESYLKCFQENPPLNQLQAPIPWRLWTGSWLHMGIPVSAILIDNENGKGTSIYWCLSHKIKQNFKINKVFL